MHRNAKLTTSSSGVENAAMRGKAGTASGRSTSAQPGARKPGIPSQPTGRAGLASSGLGRSGLGFGASKLNSAASSVRGASASSRTAAGSTHEAASSSSSSSSSAAAGMLSPTRMKTMSKAAALGLPSIVDAIREGTALQDEGLYGAGYASIIAQEWGVKKAAEGSKEHDNRARAIIRDKTAALRSALASLEEAVAAAHRVEEAVIVRFAEASALKPAVDSLTQEKGELLGRIAELDAAVAAKDSELEARGERIRSLDEQVAGFAVKEEEWNFTFDDWAAQVTAKDAELAGLEERLGEERALREALEVDLEEARAAANANSSEAEKSLADTVKKLEELRAVSAAERARWDTRDAELSGRITNLSSESVSAVSRAEAAERALAVARADIEGLQRRLDHANALYQSASSSNDSEFARLRSSNEAMERREKTLSARCDELDRRVASLTEERERLIAEEATLRRQGSDLTDRLARSTASHSEAATRAGELDAALRAANDELKRLEKSLTEAERAREEAQSRADETGGRLMEAGDKLAKLTDEAGALAAAKGQLAGHVAALESELATLRDSEATMAQELSALRETAGASESSQLGKLSSAARENETLKQRLRDAQGELKRLGLTVGVVARLREEAFAGEMERRRLHNTLQEMRGNIRVFVRVRPFLPGDDEASRAAGEPLEAGPDGAPRPAIMCAPDGTSLAIAQPRQMGGKDALPGKAGAAALAKPSKFGFDHVFGPRSGQEDVFGDVCHLVQSALDGYNVCLFSYGQTGSGKTWTMQGGSSPGSEGLIPRSVAQILSTARRLGECAGWTYTLEASFLEIYNEQVRDLLRVAPPSKGGPGASSSEPASLPIVFGAGGANSSSGEGDANAAVEVPGLTRVGVDCEADVAALLARAAKRRAVASTSMNESSSRSHSVFSLYIRGSHPSKGVAVSGTLNLVDLAGSERLDRSKAEGDRKKEAAAINKSLSCLADVFTALARKAPHVPFRNSKLTTLLAPCFRGDGKTLMLVNLSPTPASASESLCSLRFASQVAQVELGQAKKKVTALEGEGGEGAPASAAPAYLGGNAASSSRVGMGASASSASATARPAPSAAPRPKLVSTSGSSTSGSSGAISSMRALPISADYGGGGGSGMAAAASVPAYDAYDAGLNQSSSSGTGYDGIGGGDADGLGDLAEEEGDGVGEAYDGEEGAADGEEYDGDDGYGPASSSMPGSPGMSSLAPTETEAARDMMMAPHPAPRGRLSGTKRPHEAVSSSGAAAARGAGASGTARKPVLPSAGLSRPTIAGGSTLSKPTAASSAAAASSGSASKKPRIGGGTGVAGSTMMRR